MKFFKIIKLLTIFIFSLSLISSILIFGYIYYIGYKVEQSFAGALSSKVDPLFNDYNFVNLDYHKGFLNSTAVSYWRGSDGRDVVMKHKISHDLLDVYIHSSIKDSFIQDKYGLRSDEVLKATTYFFEDDMYTEFSVPGFEFFYKGKRILSKGDSRGFLHLAGGNLKKHIFIPNLEIYSDGEAYSLKNIKGDGILFARNGGREQYHLNIGQIKNKQNIIKNLRIGILGSYDDVDYSAETKLYIGEYSGTNKLGLSFEKGELKAKITFPKVLYNNFRSDLLGIAKENILGGLISGESSLVIDNFELKYNRERDKNIAFIRAKAFIDSDKIDALKIGNSTKEIEKNMDLVAHIDMEPFLINLIPVRWGLTKERAGVSMVSGRNVRFMIKSDYKGLFVNGERVHRAR